MKEPPIENRIQLKKRIMELNSLAFEQEQNILHGVKGMYYSIQPGTLLRRWASNLKEDGEVRHDLLNAGKDVALNFVMNSFLSKGNLVKRGVLVFAGKQLVRLLSRKKLQKVAPPNNS